ncbi:16934_t:CDS:1, partial [Cetraspora pellucida]
MTIPDPIWILFSKLGYVPGLKQKRSKCNKYEQQINESLRAAWIHVRRCTKISAEQKKKYLGNLYEESDDETLISISSSISESVSNSFPPSALKLYKVNRITKTEQKSLELAFARSVFYCGLFLSLPEMKPIKLLWKQARPAFKLPSRKKFSTKLLDFVFNETKNKAETLINQ